MGVCGWVGVGVGVGVGVWVWVCGCVHVCPYLCSSALHLQGNALHPTFSNQDIMATLSDSPQSILGVGNIHSFTNVSGANPTPVLCFCVVCECGV